MYIFEVVIQMSLKRKVRKNGNSHVVGLPIEIMNQLGIQDGMEIEYIKQNDDSFKIKKVSQHSREQEIINLTNEVFERYNKTMEDLVER